MFLHETRSQQARQDRQALALAAGWAVAMVVGTATLMALLAPQDDDGLERAADGSRPLHAEVVMQGAAERALASPETARMAALDGLRETRGL